VSKTFSIIATVLMLTFSFAAFQSSHANAAGYGQVEQTGAYAAGGSVSGPPAGR
jgi:hypothetical protein